MEGDFKGEFNQLKAYKIKSVQIKPQSSLLFQSLTLTEVVGLVFSAVEYYLDTQLFLFLRNCQALSPKPYPQNP